jgi:hypothetical protein
VDIVAKRSGEPSFTNSGAITLFQNSWANIQNCTFANNRNGIDDLGGQSTYENCIFYNNTIDGGLVPAPRYDLTLRQGGRVQRCSFTSAVVDPVGATTKGHNLFNAPNPKFDAQFVPRNNFYNDAGYRPPR